MTIEQIRSKMDSVFAEMDTLTKNETLNEEQETRFDELEKEYDGLKRNLERLERAESVRVEINQVSKKPIIEKTPKTEIGLSEKERQSYSFMRAITAAATGNWKGAEFELECSRAVSESLGREARGFFVPYEIQRDAMGTASGTGISDAGALVGTDHMDNMFIDRLRAESVIGRLGAQMLTGLVGDVDIPKLTGGATFYWVAEDGDVTDSTGTVGMLSLSPKTVGGAIPLTRKLMKQSAPSVEAMMRNDLILGMALAIDASAIAGTGLANQPKGILATTGVNTQTVADAAAGAGVPTFAEMVGFETALADDNALRGSLAYLTTPSINGGLKTKPIDAGSGLMVNMNGMVNGYRTYGNTNVTAKKVIFGNFNDVIIGMWGVLDLVADTSTKAASGGLVLRAFQDIDVGIRHPESFCITA